MKYFIWIVVVVIIIIIIGIIVFSVNSNKNNDNTRPHPPPAKKRNKCVIEVIETCDKTYCNKTYGHNTVDLDFRFCLNQKYLAEYYVKHVNFNEHDWKGRAKVTTQSGTTKDCRSYIEYNPDDCTYVLTLVDKSGETIVFDNPSRCITVNTKLDKCCDRQSSNSGSSECSEKHSSDCSDSGRNSSSNDHSSNDHRRNSSSNDHSSNKSSDDHSSNKSSNDHSSNKSSNDHRSNRSSNDHRSNRSSNDHDSSGSGDHHSSYHHDSIDPYSNSSHCNESTNFFPDSCSSQAVEAF